MSELKQKLLQTKVKIGVTMFNDNNDPFAGVDEANAKGGRNPYLLDGQYLLQVERIDVIRSREKKTLFLIEMKILTSTNPDRPEGLLVSWMTNLDKDMGPISCKRALAAISGIDPNSDAANEEITSDVCRLAVSEEQPFKGAQVFAQAMTVQTKAKTDFLDVKWIPVTTDASGSVVVPS